MSSSFEKHSCPENEKNNPKEFNNKINLNNNPGDTVKNNTKNYVYPFDVNNVKNTGYSKNKYNQDLTKNNDHEEKKNFSINVDNKDIISSKSSKTFFNTNPNDRLILNSTKEEENVSVSRESLEEFKTKANNKIMYLEMQLKEKSEKIKTLENKLEIGTENNKSIQKNLIEVNEKVMKLEIAQEMMKLDFLSEIEVLKLSLKEKSEKLMIENSTNKHFVKFMNDFFVYLNKSRNFLEFKNLLSELTKQDKNNLNTTADIKENNCIRTIKNTDISIANEIRITSPKLESTHRKDINNETHTRVHNTIDNNNENIFFSDISLFSENNIPYDNSRAQKKSVNEPNQKTNDIDTQNISNNNDKKQINIQRTNLKNNQYKQEVDTLRKDNSSMNKTKPYKINIKFCQSKDKDKLFNDLDCYSDDLLENTFKNLKINHKKIDRIINTIKRPSDKNQPLIHNNHRNNKILNKFETISESTINNLGSNNETFSRSLNPISSRRDYQFNSVDRKDNKYRRSIQNSATRKFEDFHYYTIMNGISHLKLKDIDHQEAPNQVILRFDEEEAYDFNQRKSIAYSEKHKNREEDYVAKSHRSKAIHNLNNLDDSLMEILSEDKKVENINYNFNANENNIDNLIDLNNTDTKKIDENYENKRFPNKISSKNLIEKFKNSQSNMNKDSKSKRGELNNNSNEENLENTSLISYGNFAVLSESSNDNSERKIETIDNKKEEINVKFNFGENEFDFNNYDKLILLENLDEKINNVCEFAGSVTKKENEGDINSTILNKEAITIKNISPIKHLNNTIDGNNIYNPTPTHVENKNTIRSNNKSNRNANVLDSSNLSNNINFSILNTSARRTNRNNLSLPNNTNKVINSSKIKEDILYKNYKNSNLRAFSLALLKNKYMVKDDENRRITYNEFSIKNQKLKEVLENENYEMDNQNSFEYNNTNENLEPNTDLIQNYNFEILNKNNKKEQQELFISREIENINLEKINMRESENKNFHNSIKSFNFTFMKNSTNPNSNKNLNRIKEFVVESNTDIQLLNTTKGQKIKFGLANENKLKIDKPINISVYKVDRKEERSITNSSINFEANNSIRVKEISESYKKKKIQTNLLVDTSDLTNINNSIQTSKKKGIFNSIFTMKILKHYNKNDDNKIVVYAGGENVIKFWDYERNEITKTLKGHTNHIYCLKQINQNLLLSGSLDKTIKLWDIHSEKCLKTFIYHSKAVSNLMKMNFKLNSQNNDSDIENLIICSAGWDGLVKFFDIESDIEKAEIKIFSNKNEHNRYDADEKENLFLSEYQKTFDMENTQQVKENTYPYINKDNKAFKTGDKTSVNPHNPVTCMKKIKLINEKEIRYLFAVAGKKINIYLVYQRFSLNNEINKLEELERNGKYRKLANSVNNLESQKFVKKINYEPNCEFAGHEGYVNDMKFLLLDYYYDSYKKTMEKIHLLTVGNDKFIKLWNIQRKEVVKVFSGHTDSVRSLLRIKFFSDENDRIIASGSADENILIWNLRTGKIIDKLEGHKDGILCLKQIPNKEKLTILSGSGGYNEEPLKIWK